MSHVLYRSACDVGVLRLVSSLLFPRKLNVDVNYVRYVMGKCNVCIRTLGRLHAFGVMCGVGAGMYGVGGGDVWGGEGRVCANMLKCNFV